MQARLASILVRRVCGKRGDLARWGEQEGFGAVTVRAVGLHMRGFETAKNLITRVPEGIVAADADDGIAGSDRTKKLGVGRGLASVVADLEECDGREAMVAKHGIFAGRFGVAFEERAGATVVDA